MNIVLFQYLGDIFILSSVIAIVLAYKMEKKGLIKILIVIDVIIFLLKGVIYFNFAEPTKRIKKEEQASTQIFQAKMKEPEKRIKEFNYTENFDDTSSSIDEEVNKIHKSVLKGQE